MKALSGNIIEKVEKTYNGGCDVILYCQGKLDEMQNIYSYSKSLEKKKYNFIISKFSQKKLKNDILELRKELRFCGVIDN